MEIVYAVDLKLPDNGAQLKHILTMDISCLNILAFSSLYLPKSNQWKYSPYLQSASFTNTDQTIFCVYICALEQPWYFHLITTSNSPFVQLSWSLNGNHLLTCDRTGLCQVFQMKNGCINTMDKLYQYQINEEILSAKYIFPRETIVINLDRNDSIFHRRDDHRSAQLHYALHTGNFLCVTSSGTIHTLPIQSSLAPYSYLLSQNEPLGASYCDIYPINQGVNIILGEYTQGALIHFFVVHYNSLETKLSYTSSRASGFRIPSCYGTIQSLKYFQRYSIDCILTHMRSSSGDVIDLYEYKTDRKEWISISLFNSSQVDIRYLALPNQPWLIEDPRYQGLFTREILLALNDGSIISFDQLNLQCRERWCGMKQTDYFLQIQRTHSGLCSVGFTQNGQLILLRAMTLDQISSFPSIINILVHLFERYILQKPCPCDLWDVLCIIPNTSMINELIDRLVTNFERQTLEFKRMYFVRLKECLYHLDRLARPTSKESCEHLTSLIIYHILSIVREYLRLFIYEPTHRNFVDAAQEILQQPSFMQNIDIKQIKYLGDQLAENNRYQLISFMKLIDWVTNIIFSLLSYFQSQRSSHWLVCGNILTDVSQLQWLREFVIYCSILHHMNKIPSCQITNLYLNSQRDLLKDIYHTLTKFSQRIGGVENINGFMEEFFRDFPVLALETFQSKIENMFPQFFPFLLPNSSKFQTFQRDQFPFDDISDIQFDTITLGKMSLSSNQTFFRCLRCSNFTRTFHPEPYPFLAYRLNHRCICGGVFVQYTQ